MPIAGFRQWVPFSVQDQYGRDTVNTILFGQGLVLFFDPGRLFLVLRVVGFKKDEMIFGKSQEFLLGEYFFFQFLTPGAPIQTDESG